MQNRASYLHQVKVGENTLDLLDDLGLGRGVEFHEFDGEYRLLFWFLLFMSRSLSMQDVSQK